ncbi:MAG TPA: peptide ABC transporter substrate-binding protein [Stellaceae bacterium]|jgi:peptide/nickel transport system substrate-binding protein
MMTDRLNRLFRLIFTAGLMAAAMPSGAAEHTSLTIGVTQYPGTLNPNIDPLAAKGYVLGFTLRPFTVFDPEWKLVCLLCTTVPSFDNGLAVPVDLPNGKRGVDVTYTIRPDAMWGDGVPVTTKDVEFTWKVGRDPKSPVSNAEMYRHMTGITIKDDKTFTIHDDKLDFTYAAINDFTLLPEHLEKAAFADPAQYRQKTLYVTDPTNPGLYNGPYRVGEASGGSYIVLERNPHWAGKPGPFDRITIRAIENTAALEANLLSGTVDMAAGEVGLPLDEGLAFEKRHGAAYDVVFKPGLIFEHVDFNLEVPAFQDRRLREAMLRAIDREGLCKSLFSGKQQPADTFLSPLDVGYTDDVPHYPYDPARAAALLDEAGWHMGPGGTRRNAAGEALSFTLMTTAGNHSRELVEQVLQSEWKKVGIDIKLKNEPPRVLFGETLLHRQFQLAMYAWISSPENVPREIFDSGEIPSAGNGYSGENLAGYKNPKMDELLKALELELDPQKRKAMWAEAQKIFAADLPFLPLYLRTDTFILPKWLGGVEPTGNQYPTSLWVTDWTVKK